MNRIDEIVSAFKYVADHPEIVLQAVTSSGRKAIGCMPMYCPQELVYATGMTPISIWGGDITVSAAKRYFPTFICSIMQTSLELGLQGKLSSLSGMMIPALCDSMKCMGQNWKAGVPQVPYIPLFHPQNRKAEVGIAFLKSEYTRVLRQLEDIAGAQVSPEELDRAIEVYNVHRRSMQRFYTVAARYPQIITPTIRNWVVKSAGFMDVAAHTALIDELVFELEKQEPVQWKGKKVVVTGITADSPELLEIFEEYDIAIAADELADSSRRFRTLVPQGGEPIERLARQMAEHEGCSVMFDPQKKRGGMILDMVRQTGASGVIVLMTKFCDPEEFDYAILYKQFAAADVPHLMIEVDRQARNYGQARTAIQAFADII